MLRAGFPKPDTSAAAVLFDEDDPRSFERGADGLDRTRRNGSIISFCPSNCLRCLSGQAGNIGLRHSKNCPRRP